MSVGYISQNNKRKCKTTLILLIKKGRNRFGEMKKTLPTISEQMISRQLDELEKDGIIRCESFLVTPPRVEYYLAEYGETINRLSTKCADGGICI